MNYFVLFRLNVGEGYVVIDAILPIDRSGNVIEVIPFYQFHYDDFSDGNEEFLPKVGEHIQIAQDRIELYIKKHLKKKIQIEMRELPELDNYVNRLFS